MTRLAFLIYGIVGYLLSIAALVYAIGFVANLVVPKGIDDGEPTSAGVAVAVDLVLFGLIAIQHNVMARPRFKRWWTRYVPRPIERSTYVTIAGLLFFLLFWQWRPIPGIVWEIDSTAVRGLLWALYFVGWAIAFYSSFVIDHFELFGLKQVVLYFRGQELAHPPFSERSIYRLVRHPLMLGFILAFWSAPTMSWGRLLFAAVMSAWILFSIQIEEHDLAHILGDPYVRYRSRTPMLIPGLRFGSSKAD